MKLIKNKYRTLKGDIKVNSYLLNISKKVVEESGIKDTDNIKVYANGNKIIVEKL